MVKCWGNQKKNKTSNLLVEEIQQKEERTLQEGDQVENNFNNSFNIHGDIEGCQ